MTSSPDRLGGKRQMTSANLTVDTLPATDGALIYGSSLDAANPHYGFMRVGGAWYGITNRKRYSSEEVVEIAQREQYDRIYNGL